MKKSFHVFFLFVLFAFFAVNAAWADYGVNSCYTAELEVSPDKSRASEGEIVTLTITPSTSYLFKGLEVTNEDKTEMVDVDLSGVNAVNGGTATFTMPSFNVNVDCFYEAKPYAVRIYDGRQRIKADRRYALEGETVTLTIQADPEDDSYELARLDIQDKDFNMVNVTISEGTATFSMPPSEVQVIPRWAMPYDVEINNVSGGTVTADKETALAYQTVTLTITPDDHYVLTDLKVKDKNGNSVNAVVSDGKATFTMPSESKVIVTPFWDVNVLTEDGEGGYYVNMPVSGTNTLDLTEYVANGVTSFKVYDDGGKDGNFSSFVNGYLEMTAPAGYQFIIQGSMNATCADGSCVTGELNVFDGNASATRILQKWYNVPNINVHSSGNTMTLYFKYGSANYDYDTYSGLDFTVTVFTPHGVNIVGVEGGRVSTDKETADEGTMVTLTATPDEGYMLNGISVVDIDGNSVSGTWYIGVNTFTFNMPAEAVFVTPLFVPVGDVFVNMPKTGNMEVVIPEGMESIKVYDDGGKDGNYSDKSDAILQLTAPENYVFQISGSATTEVTYDDLEIFDGTNIADNFLLLKTINNGSVDLNGANILTSSNNVITLCFYSNDYTNKSGFDLKVTLVKPSYGAVSIAKADDGKIHATINGDYSGNETLVISEAIEVDAIDYNREIDVETPVTALLPVTLPAGTTVNADFYTLEKVEQVEGMKWQATMTYIGKNNLPQPNTPYAVILPKGQTKLEFDLKGNKATVQTGKIKKVCGLSDCKLDENEQITDDWFFTGTYAYKQWNTGDEELGLAYAFAASDNPDGAAKGKFGKIKAGAFANAMRCYLRKRDAKVKLQQQNQAQMVAASPYVARYSINNLPETIDVEFVKNDEKGGRTVLRGRMNTVTGEFKMLRDYDLKGRKVNGVNKARGAYYGKKVLKK
jgi:hypothetical protein